MMGMIQPGYISTQGFQCFNVTQGHKPSYTTSYISIPNNGDDSTCLSKQGFHLAINKLGIDPILKGMSNLNTSFRDLWIYSQAVSSTVLLYRSNFI